MVNTRKTAVAGTFYPAEPEQLKLQLAHYINDAECSKKVPKAIIAPHAGYIYSGEVAGTVYARLHAVKDVVTQVVLMGPSHRVGFQGLAVSSADQFATPLGNISVDAAAIEKISAFPFIQVLDQAHQLEHSLEVHLPFLQSVLSDFSIVPVVAGDASADQVCQLLEQFWGQQNTLIVISSDLSHFHDYETAQKMDEATTAYIERLQYEKLTSEMACGYVPIRGLLALARKNELQIKTIDLRNSADSAGTGDKGRVVGYGAYVIE